MRVAASEEAEGLDPEAVQAAIRLVDDSLPMGADQTRVFRQVLRILHDPEGQGNPITSTTGIFSHLGFEGRAWKSETGKYRIIYQWRDGEPVTWISIGHRKEVYGKGRTN